MRYYKYTFIKIYIYIEIIISIVICGLSSGKYMQPYVTCTIPYATLSTLCT